MAIYHCSIKIGSRSKGQSAIAASAYRSGTKLHDFETGLTSDFTLKRGVIFSEISLCKNAPSEYSDRETLWNAVHKIEKNQNSQLWREFEVALPQELNREQQKEAVRMFVNKLTEQGMCVDWALHDKGDGNPHAHIMTTMRSIEPSGKWVPKCRKVYDLDENGKRILQKIDKSGRKQYKSHKENYNDWNEKERVEEWRSYWAECCNVFLSSDRQIDHRSYDRQGAEQIPTIHEGYVARKLIATGRQSDRVQINADRRMLNAELTKYSEIGTLITRLDTINSLIEDWNEKIRLAKKVQKLQPIMNGRKGLSERKKAKYDSANSSDIAAYREAIKQLKVWYPNGSPTPKFMEEKKNALVQERSEKNARYKELKSEVKELEEYLSQERGHGNVSLSEVTEEHNIEKTVPVKALNEKDESYSTKLKDKKFFTLNDLKATANRVSEKPREPKNNEHSDLLPHLKR